MKVRDTKKRLLNTNITSSNNFTFQTRNHILLNGYYNINYYTFLFSSLWDMKQYLFFQSVRKL